MSVCLKLCWGIRLCAFLLKNSRPTGGPWLATWAACIEKELLPLASARPAALKDAGRRVSSRPEIPGALSAAGKGYASYDFAFSLQIKGQFMSV